MASAVALGIGAEAAQATFPTAREGRIVFTREGSGGTPNEVFVVAPDGSGLFSPTAGLADGDSDASISANGKRLAVTHDVDPDPGTFKGSVFLIDSDGSNPVNLTMAPSATQEDQSSVFFVDGKRFAFARHTFAPPATDLYLIDSDGSGLTPLLSGAGTIQSVDDISPDGKRLLLSRDSDPGAGVNLDIFAINLDGSELVNLTPGIPDIDQAASFSPDGKRIAFNRRGNFQPADILVMNADGSGAVNLTNTPADEERAPVFSPTGKRIAFTKDVGGGDDVYVMGSDGSGQAPLVTGGDDSVDDWEAVYRCAGKRATIVGSDSRDKIKGTKRRDVIVGNGGKDKIRGRGGRDRICGGRGRDTLIGGGGTDRLLGGKGKDKEKQ